MLSSFRINNEWVHTNHQCRLMALDCCAADGHLNLPHDPPRLQEHFWHIIKVFTRSSRLMQTRVPENNINTKSS